MGRRRESPASMPESCCWCFPRGDKCASPRRIGRNRISRLVRQRPRNTDRRDPVPGRRTAFRNVDTAPPRKTPLERRTPSEVPLPATRQYLPLSGPSNAGCKRPLPSRRRFRAAPVRDSATPIPEEVCIGKNSRDLVCFGFCCCCSCLVRNWHVSSFGILKNKTHPATWSDRLQKREPGNSKAGVGMLARCGDARLRRFESGPSRGVLHRGVPMPVALVHNFVGILRRVFVDRVLHGFFPSSAAIHERQISIELFDPQVSKLLVPRTTKQARRSPATHFDRAQNRPARLNRYLPM